MYFDNMKDINGRAMGSIDRRRFALGGTALCATLGAPAGLCAAKPEFALRFANFSPLVHPVNIRMAEARERVVRETDGRVDIQTVAQGELGSNDDMLGRLRSGEIDFFLQSGLVLESVAPAASITGLGFAFSRYGQVWDALDGELGKAIVDAFSKTDIVLLDRAWDNGFRQTTSSKRAVRTPQDLAGMKVRVPQWPMWTSMYTALGATPVSIPWNKTYAGLKDGTADAVENPLAGIHFAKLYEVQGYLSRTNHIWDGFWFLANRRRWQALPERLRSVIETAINDAAVKERADVARAQEDLFKDLVARGLQASEVDSAAFRRKLREAGFYREWKAKFDWRVWALLERQVGDLA